VAIIAAALVALTVVVVIVGSNDKSNETVTASEWVDSVCGAVGVWRGEMRSIVKDVRLAPAYGGSSDEPQSEVKRGRVTALRQGLDNAVRATQTMATAVDNAGIPDTPEGETAAGSVANWANASADRLQDAQVALDSKPDSLEEAVDNLATVTTAFRETLTSAVSTMTGVVKTDPQLAAAALSSTTCRQMNEEEDSA
jgi:hypothetical protein